MGGDSSDRRKIRFGVFELDLAAWELRKSNRKVKIEELPLQLLRSLVLRPGEVVNRDELRRELWPQDTFVDFDHSLNTAVKKVRKALGDSPHNSRFIETVPKRGYRFIGPLTSEIPAAPTTSRRRWLEVAAGLLVLIGAVAFVRWITGSGAASESALMAVPLTTYQGSEVHPRISPDGTQVAYVSCPDENCDIYIKQIGVEEPYRLTDHAAADVDPAWSPDGQHIAFIRGPLPGESTVAILTVPQRGGPERIVVEKDFTGANPLPIPGPLVDWTPDGQWLVVPGFGSQSNRSGLFLISVETGEKRRLTVPPPDSWGDSTPAVSPDGRELVFTRHRDLDRSDIYVLRLSPAFAPEGEPARLTFDFLYNGTPSWTPDGRDIIFYSGTGSQSGLWRMPVKQGAKQHRLPLSDARATCPTISRSGERLVYCVGRGDVNIWRLDLKPDGEAAAKTEFIASTYWDGSPILAPDGERIAFGSSRSGAEEIWVCDRDGSNVMQLTDLGQPKALRPRWSPDGKLIAFYSTADENEEVFTVRASGGTPQRLTNHPAIDQHPSFSSDGKWIYFSSNRGGEQTIWKMPADGGEAEQVIATGSDGPQESPDGRFVYFERGWPNQFGVWRAPVGGGEEIQMADSVHPFAGWTLGKQGLYWVTTPDKDGKIEVRFRGFGAATEQTLATLDRQVQWGITVSPDGQTILYSQVDEGTSDLMLVEDFR